ncbi:MAG: hypothetical protein IT428_31485 [Planctomycetaceae bacterium]|nr:hypothetical protein [Planctomycetaceae bacterium]
MTALASPPPALRTATQSRGVVPQRGETQAAFAERYHSTMAKAIPQTERRDVEMMKCWRQANQGGDLEARCASRFPSDQFVRVRDVPVFAEHTTKDREGKPVVYNRAALQAIADRCNERILDTGDFAPITDGHTPSNEDLSAGRPMPVVLGYAGPFRLGQIGNRNPRWAIFCDEFHHVGDRSRLLKLQRRSPEVWLEPRMEDRFMDPIAALGAETPRLDLGMSRFCRTADGRTVEKYSAVAPPPVATGANTTYVPGDTKDPKRRYEAEGNNPVDESQIPEELVDRIIAAFMQTKPMQFVLQQMEAKTAPNVDPTAAPPAPGAEPPAGMDPAAPAVPGMEEPAPEVPAMPGNAPAGDVATPPAEAAMPATPEAPAAPEKPTPAAEPEAAAESDEDEPYEPDDEDREQFARYMAGACSNEDMEQYRAHKKARRRKHYAAESPADSAPLMESPDMATPTTQYARSGDTAKYAKIERENAELKARLDRVEKENRERATAERYARREAETMADRRDFVFDEAAELEHIKDLPEDQYARHVEMRRQNYQRIGTNQRLYVPPAIDAPPARDTGARQTTAAESEAAIALHAKYQRSGTDKSFDQCLDEVRAKKAPSAKTA